MPAEADFCRDENIIVFFLLAAHVASNCDWHFGRADNDIPAF